MTPLEVSEGLGLSAIKERQYAIFQASALKGTGITEGVDWLVNSISSNSATARMH